MPERRLPPVAVRARRRARGSSRGATSRWRFSGGSRSQTCRKACLSAPARPSWGLATWRSITGNALHRSVPAASSFAISPARSIGSTSWPRACWPRAHSAASCCQASRFAARPTTGWRQRMATSRWCDRAEAGPRALRCPLGRDGPLRRRRCSTRFRLRPSPPGPTWKSRAGRSAWSRGGRWRQSATFAPRHPRPRSRSRSSSPTARRPRGGWRPPPACG